MSSAWATDGGGGCAEVRVDDATATRGGGGVRGLRATRTLCARGALYLEEDEEVAFEARGAAASAVGSLGRRGRRDAAVAQCRAVGTYGCTYEPTQCRPEPTEPT